VVRLRVPKVEDQGRTVAAGSSGAVVHVYAGEPPSYLVEVVIADAAGMQTDAHLFFPLKRLTNGGAHGHRGRPG
jgi:hypothetical protein